MMRKKSWRRFFLWKEKNAVALTDGNKKNTIRVPAQMKGHIQRHVLDARRSKGLNREYTNWEMTLSIERDKGKAEGKSEGEISYLITSDPLETCKRKAREDYCRRSEGSSHFSPYDLFQLQVCMDSPAPEDILISYLEQMEKSLNA